jgi:2-hydroxychromene-2-carboxylate isomerase
MKKIIKYYFSPMSCWTYLGHERFHQITKDAKAEVIFKPFDPLRLFAAAGGLPLAQRPLQRQKYRLIELNRWKSYLNSPITIEPKFFPYDPRAASLAIVATNNLYGQEKAMLVTQKLLEGCWVHEKDMSSTEEINSCLENCSLDIGEITRATQQADVIDSYDKNTDDAINDDVFGAPTFLIDGEPFWGQDRLDFVERKLNERL